MRDKRYRTYTPEFKREALELLKNSGKSAGQLERELGITPGMLLKWRAKYQMVTSEKEPPRLEPSDLEAALLPAHHSTPGRSDPCAEPAQPEFLCLRAQPEMG
ncbi:transposase [Longilinea arvoryzae]|uniref:Transposase n=1 Tax=Longilinea arvoryzae TaxID=360412 RepID=A0A0S7B7V4_9CHLR|nr:transposase [Longilinea arvoryzae]GAP13230.1 transposase [Longilinea arvoryzae]